MPSGEVGGLTERNLDLRHLASRGSGAGDERLVVDGVERRVRGQQSRRGRNNSATNFGLLEGRDRDGHWREEETGIRGGEAGVGGDRIQEKTVDIRGARMIPQPTWDLTEPTS